MTSKDKAIKAFQRIAWETDTNQKHGITGEFMLVNDIRATECDDVRNYLAQPSLDDCIAVVEKMIGNTFDINEYRIMEKEGMKQVLTALRGLKEGK